MPTFRLRRPRRPWLLALTLSLTALQLLLLTGSLRLPTLLYYNGSASEPTGWYLVVPWLRPLRHGDKVLLRVPPDMEAYAFGRGWMRSDEPMLKTVYGLPGDRFSIDAREIRVNGAAVGEIRASDSQGLPLPALRGDFAVPPEHILPLALNRPNSFDGRYFGAVPATLIRHRVIPLLLD